MMAPLFTRRSQYTPMLWGQVALLLGVSILSVGVGPSGVGLLDAWAIVLGTNEPLGTSALVVTQLRVPRILLAALIGSAMGCAGVVSQGLFRNALAEPGVLGITTGAALGAVVGFVLGLDTIAFGMTPLLAALGAVLTMLLLFALSGANRSLVTLLLSGVALGALGSACITFLLTLEVERWEVGIKVLGWLMGSFEGRSWIHLAWGAVPIGLGLAIARWLEHDLDLLHLGTHTAQSLGLVWKRTRFSAVVCIGLLVGTATSLVGVIGFVGLMVPHLGRLLVGPGHRLLMPTSALLGATLLVVVDLCTRAITALMLPPGVITSLLGAPFFLWLLARHEGNAP